MGYRLPLASLPACCRRTRSRSSPPIPSSGATRSASAGRRDRPRRGAAPRREKAAAKDVVKTALCVEAREGRLHVFLPPVALAEDFVSLVAAIEATSPGPRAPGAPRGLPAARRPADRALRRHPRPRRDRGEHPPGLRLGRARPPRDRALRGGAAREARHREVHARRPPHRHRRRQPRHHRRADRRRQPAASPARPAALPHHLLADPPRALLPLLRALHRPDEPEPARGRGARRRALRARHRLRAARARASRRARRTRSRGSWTGSCAISSSTSPATRTAPSSPSTSSTRRAAPRGAWACWSSAPSRCRRTRA